MKDEASRKRPEAHEPDDDDEIQILEVVGLDPDEESPTSADAEETGLALVDEDDDPNEFILSLDDTDPSELSGLLDAEPASAGRDVTQGDPGDHERLLRLQADFASLRNRLDRERKEFQRNATTALVTRLLPVVDNFERALAHRDESPGQDFRRGVELIHRQLIDELAKEGLTPVEAVGKPFDPKRHEAVATEASSEHPPNTILEEFQKGYLFQDRLLRPALVKVSVDAVEHAAAGAPAAWRAGAWRPDVRPEPEGEEPSGDEES